MLTKDRILQEVFEEIKMLIKSISLERAVELVLTANYERCRLGNKIKFMLDI